MKRRRELFFPVAALAFVVAGMAVAPAWAADAVVTLKSGKLDFSPKKVVIRMGERVIWKNPSKEVHSVTSLGNEEEARTAGGKLEINKLVKPGEEYAYRFQVSGTYFYYCPIHQGMWGTVVVQ